jgi:hypothetical protein
VHRGERAYGDRVGAGGQPDRTALRTVRESFPSHGAKASPVRTLSKDALSRGVPAICWMNVNILSPLYARPDQSSSPFAGCGPATQNSGGARSFSAHHLSLSPLRGTPMTEKWMTEKCAQSSAARTAALMPLEHSFVKELRACLKIRFSFLQARLSLPFGVHALACSGGVSP